MPYITGSIDDLLYTSVANGYLEGVDYALKNGANPNNTNLPNSLITAIDTRSLEIMDRLLQFPGIRINVKDSRGVPALIKVVRSGSLEMVDRLLQEKSLNVNLTEYYANHALHIAMQNKYTDIALRLLDHPKININSKDDYGGPRSYPQFQKVILQFWTSFSAFPD
jgi:ankyrin repeat protein